MAKKVQTINQTAENPSTTLQSESDDDLLEFLGSNDSSDEQNQTDDDGDNEPETTTEAKDKPKQWQTVQGTANTSIPATEGVNPTQLHDKSITKWTDPPAACITNWDTFESWINTFTKYQWQNFMGYLYRVTPVINRPQGERYIDKFPGTLESGRDANLNLEYITAIHGGGKYKLVVNNESLIRMKRDAVTGKQTRNAGEVCEVKFSISWDKKHPVINLAELVLGHKENKAYIELLIKEGKLTPDGRIATPAAPTSDTAAVTKELTELLKTVMSTRERGGDTSGFLNAMANMQKQMVDIVKDQRGSKSELEIITVLIPVLQGLIENKNPKGTGDDMLVKLLISANETNAKLLEKILTTKSEPPPPPPPPVDPFASLDKMLDIQKKLQEMNPANVAATSDDDDDDRGKKKKPMDYVMESLPILLPSALSLLGAITVRLMGGDPNQQQQQQSQYTQPMHQQPLQLPASGQPMTLDQPTTQQPNPNTNAGLPTQQPLATPGHMTIPNPQDQINRLLPVIRDHGQIIIQAIYDGEHGANFAEMLQRFLGKATYITICSLGEAGILQAFKSVPEFWATLTNKEEQVKQFIKEFVNPNDGDNVEGEAEIPEEN